MPIARFTVVLRESIHPLHRDTLIWPFKLIPQNNFTSFRQENANQRRISFFENTARLHVHNYEQKIEGKMAMERTEF